MRKRDPDEGAGREAALGMVCAPGLYCRERCVSVFCGLWGRNFPRGGVLEGKTGPGEGDWRCIVQHRRRLEMYHEMKTEGHSL